MSSPPLIVTTSWDDGHPLDRKVAEMLARYGLKGTFYIPIQYLGRAVDVKALAGPLQELGMEIGSHTVTHSVLTKLTGDEVRRELRDSKEALEQRLSARVRSFCYPKGKHNRRIAALSREAGYHLARTTVAFHTDLKFDPELMPVSFQMCPPAASQIVRHALRESNWRGLLRWSRAGNGRHDLVPLAQFFLAEIRRTGGILHIWGHSWELDRYGLWGTLDQILRDVSQESGALHLTNVQTLLAIKSQSPGCAGSTPTSAPGCGRVLSE
jgi:peptidoglycan-N-acetylglucosamine deacetylase